MANLIPVILEKLGLEENERFKVKYEDGFISKNIYYFANKDLMNDSFPDCQCHEQLGKLVNGELEVVKIKHLSDDEKVILRNVNNKFKWIAREKNDNLYVYENKPIKVEFRWSGYPYNDFYGFDHLFQCIQWSDSEPTLIEDLLKE